MHGRWLINGTPIKQTQEGLPRAVSHGIMLRQNGSGICEQSTASNDGYCNCPKVSLAIAEHGLLLLMGGFNVKSEVTSGKNSRKPQSQKLSTNCAEFPVSLWQFFAFKITHKKAPETCQIARTDRTAKQPRHLSTNERLRSLA